MMKDSMLSRILFLLARSDIAGPMVRWGFGHLAWLLPVKRVATTPSITAFYHPKPAWETHILLVPKVGISSLVTLDRAQEPIILNILLLAHKLGQGLRGAKRGNGALCLIVNGGAYQDVGQVHFHLAAGSGVQHYSCPRKMPTELLLNTDSICVFHHPDPVRVTHIVIRPVPAPSVGYASAAIGESQVRALIMTTKELVRSYNLADNGFSLIAGGIDGELDYSCFHLVSGKLVES